MIGYPHMISTEVTKMFKKIITVLLAVLMLLVPMTGCVQDQKPVVTIEGVSFTPGQYLMYQLDSYQVISTRMEYTFEGTSIKQQMSMYDSENAVRIDVWISSNTLEELRLNVYFQKKFAELGLTISEEDAKSNHENAVKIYENYEVNYDNYYSRNGISLESLEFWLTDQFRRTEVFNKLYQNGGELAPTDDEMKAFVAERYGRGKFLAIPFYNLSTGEMLDSEEIENIEYICADMADRLNAGEDIDDLNKESLLALGQIKEDETPEPVDDFFFDTESSDFSTEMMNIFADTPYNTATWYKDEYYGYYYVLLRLDPLAEDVDYFNTYYNTILNTMKYGEFLEAAMEITGDYEPDMDVKSAQYYKPEKIFALPTE